MSDQETGQSKLEYALVLVFVTIAVIVILVIVGTHSGGTFSNTVVASPSP